MTLSVEPILDSEQTRLRYAFSLLIDPSRSWWSDLCRCQYAPCHAFYLASQSGRGGPPNRRYCNAEHRYAAHDANRTARRHRNRDAAGAVRTC